MSAAVLPLTRFGVGTARRALGAVAVVLVAGLAFAASLRRPVVRSDEAWFLWVAVRANAGATLYRGVYFVTTPLAMWFMQAGVWLFGAHVWVERALASASLALSLCFLWRIAGRLGVRRGSRIALLGFVFWYGSSRVHFASAYSMLAVGCTLGALDALCRHLDDQMFAGTRRLPVLVGVWCAAAFAAKPNIGLAAIGVAVLLLLRDRRSRRASWNALAVPALTFAAGVAAMLVPIVLSRSMTAFVGDVFLGKGSAYLAVETRGLPWVNPLPILSLVLCLVALRRVVRHERVSLLAVLAFASVGFVAAAPDFALQHVTEATPLLAALPVLAISGSRRSVPDLRRTVMVGALGVLAVALLVGTSWSHGPLLGGRHRVIASRLAPVSGTLTTDVSEVRVRADVARLRRLDGPVYLAMTNASFYYLVGRLHDPTPFDYPARSDLGLGGEHGLIEELRSVHVRWVCLRHYRTHLRTSIDLTQLETYVHHHFDLVTRLTGCDLYRLGSTS